LWLQHNQAVQMLNLYAEAIQGGKKQGQGQPTQAAPRRIGPSTDATIEDILNGRR